MIVDPLATGVVTPVRLLLAAFALGLVVMLARVRRRDRRSALRFACGLGGLAALAIALGPPLDRHADALLSMHMVQHLLLQVVAAPLLVAAAPVRMLLGVLPRRTGRHLARGLQHPVVRILGNPAVGVGVFATTLAVVHLPTVYEAALRHPLVHDAEHAALFWSACWLWAPIVRADPFPYRSGAVGRVAVLLAAMATMSVVGAVLATGSHVIYPSYVGLAGAAAALSDQSLAGGLMWIGGMVVCLPLLLLLAWRALAEEERRAQVRGARSMAGRDGT